MSKPRSMLEFVVGLIDPFMIVEPSVQLRVEQEESSWLKKSALVNFILWPTAFIFLLIAIDKSKTNYNMWIVYRVGTAVIILVLALISLVFKNKKELIRLMSFLAAGVLATTIAWSMTFGASFAKGYYLIPPLVILVSVSRSFIFPSLWIIFLALINKPFWSTRFPDNAITAEVITSIAILLFAHLGKRIWLESKVNKYLYEDLTSATIEKQMEFDRNIKSFISPVLVEKIEAKTRSGESLVAALDSVLMRKSNKVSVLFNDVRNFSTRSIDSHFVENELIPASSIIIDRSESNMGVAKQIGDAVFVYYSLDDPEESLLRAMKDGIIGCIEEKKRVESLNRDKPERFFSLSYGIALVGNMASAKHREATVIGSPANLAARMDSLTKETEFSTLVADGTKIIMSEEAVNTARTFHDRLNFQKIDLTERNLVMKSFPDEKNVYLLASTSENINILNEVLAANNLTQIQC